MSRSRRKPASYICYGATPKQGKSRTSRELRRKVRQALLDEDFDFYSNLDRNRGNGGSKDEDFGWDDFGDGKINPYKVDRWFSEDEIEELKRK